MSSDSEAGLSKRAQLKELRNQCRAALKAAGSDKKKRAEIDEHFSALETQLKHPQNVEVKSEVVVPNWSINDKGVSRSQHRRDEKIRAEDQERAIINQRYAGNEHFSREELADISSHLKKESEELGRHLMIHQVPSDGSCLFQAIAASSSGLTADTLRSSVVDHITKHRFEFEPFIDSNFEQYLASLRTEAWGGELEIKAMSDLLSREIKVFRKDGIVSYSPDSVNDRNPIRISYHKYQFASPHYNAVL